LRDRYIRHLDLLIALTERECDATAPRKLLSLSEFIPRIFCGRYGAPLSNNGIVICLEFFDSFAGLARLNNGECGDATRILPILQQSPEAAQAQIAIGCDQFPGDIRRRTEWVWLQNAPIPLGIGKSLQAENIRWFIIDAHALGQALPPARRGLLRPVYKRGTSCVRSRNPGQPSGLERANKVIPVDPAYRDFYRDIGFDLSARELAPLPGNSFTGIKYHRVTGRDVAKQIL